MASLATLAGCGEGDAGKSSGGGNGGGMPPTAVIATTVADHDFVDRIEAIGTAYALESVVISANVTERVKTLHFDDGVLVREGQVLAELDHAEEQGALVEARARLREAQLQLERIQQLQARGFATSARLDTQIAERDAARGTIDAIEARIADRVIRAPFTGIAGLRRVSPGLIVTAGTPIVQISDIAQVKLDFTIPENYLSVVRVGQEVRARAAAFNNQPFTGRIEAIDPQVDAVTRAVSVRAIIPNPDFKLKPGMLLTVDIVRQTRRALAVPELAVIGEQDRKFVYVIDPQTKKAVKTRILTGEREPGFVEVTSGIGKGALIVAEGTVKMRDGSPVTVLKTVSAEPGVPGRAS